MKPSPKKSSTLPTPDEIYAKLDTEKVVTSLLDLAGCKHIKRRGDEINSTCPSPSHDDENPSFSVNVGTLHAPFKCMGCGIDGNLQTLVQIIKQVDKAAALTYLRQEASISTASPVTTAATPREAESVEQPKQRWKPVSVPPDKIHRLLVNPPQKAANATDLTKTEYRYLDADGNLHTIQVRFDWTDDKGNHRKAFMINAVYQSISQGHCTWRPEAHPSPRPLYNLNEVVARPDVPVIVPEGEKAGEAIKANMPSAVITTSMCGADNPHHSDWSPLKGRKVVIWRDRDSQGLAYQQAVTDLVRAAGAESVHCVNIAILEEVLGTTLQEGDDAADVVQRFHWGQAEFEAFLARPDALVEPVIEPSLKSFMVASPSVMTWPSIRSLVPPEIVTIPMDIDKVLPPSATTMKDFLRAVSHTLQVPIEMPTMLAMSIVSLAVSQAVEVEPQDGWREVAALWFLMLALPGERKTAIMKLLSEPIDSWTLEETTKLKIELAKHAEKKRMAERILESNRTTLSKPVGGKHGPATGADQQALLAENEKLLTELAEFEEFFPPSLIASDATPEAIAELLHKNGEKLGIISAEGDAVDHVLGRYSDKPNFGIYLSGHGGDAYPVHRRGRPTLQIRHPTIAVGLMVQPQAVAEMLGDEDALGRGMVARFLMSRPESWIGRRQLVTQRVPDHLRSWWSERIKELLDLPHPGKVILGESGVIRCTSDVVVKTLTPEASAAFLAFRELWETQLMPEVGSLAGMHGWGEKLTGHIARIALCLHMLGNQGPTINLETMQAAIAWADYLIPHAKAIFGEAALTEDDRDALKILRWIKREQKRTFSRSEAFQAVRTKAKAKAEDWDDAFKRLAGHGYIRDFRIKATTEAGGRPSPGYEVNPAVWSEETQETQDNQETDSDDDTEASAAVPV